jgi:putative membrane protein
MGREKEAIMMWWNDGWPMPWIVGPFMMTVVVVLCGTMMFFMMRGMMGGHGGRSNDRVALDILKQRFARGEITQAEYEERRRLLEV